MRWHLGLEFHFSVLKVACRILKGFGRLSLYSNIYETRLSNGLKFKSLLTIPEHLSPLFLLRPRLNNMADQF